MQDINETAAAAGASTAAGRLVRRVADPRAGAVIAFARYAVAASAACGAAALAQEDFTTTDRMVPHVSTVPANEGDRVELFVREKLSADLEDRIEARETLEGRVVLFVHGVSVPSVPDFDLPFKDYSWMQRLAAENFDTFSVDVTGYGFSPTPTMDDPCNMSPADQEIVMPNPLTHGCVPEYGFLLTSSQTDWDEIDVVVDYIRELRGVERVSLVGWSLGGLRAGGYAARHPDKIDKLVLFAPVYQPDSAAEPPVDFPRAGVPMTLQTRMGFLQDRWESNVRCENQLEPGIQDEVWRTIMAFDPLGAVWGPPEGVMRVRTAEYWGWNTQVAAQVTAPTLILVGLQDGLLPGGRALYRDLTRAPSKVMVEMDCATHFALWEASQYEFMHAASLEWLEGGTFRGETGGSYSVGFGGSTQ